MKADRARFAPARRSLPVKPLGREWDGCLLFHTTVIGVKEYHDRPQQYCGEVLRADLA
jgi:hypothetical protein